MMEMSRMMGEAQLTRAAVPVVSTTSNRLLPFARSESSLSPTASDGSVVRSGGIQEEAEVVIQATCVRDKAIATHPVHGAAVDGRGGRPGPGLALSQSVSGSSSS